MTNPLEHPYMPSSDMDYMIYERKIREKISSGKNINTICAETEKEICEEKLLRVKDSSLLGARKIIYNEDLFRIIMNLFSLKEGGSNWNDLLNDCVNLTNKSVYETDTAIPIDLTPLYRNNMNQTDCFSINGLVNHIVRTVSGLDICERGFTMTEQNEGARDNPAPSLPEFLGLNRIEFDASGLKTLGEIVEKARKENFSNEPYGQ